MTKALTPVLLQLCRGKSPGVSITANDGQPGNGMSILIRGITTVNNTDPLILIDGVPADINSISPNDIEAVQVLEDASAAAIYGSRAANGVILVTSKSGKKGAMKVEANVDFGAQQMAKKLSLCTTDEWIKVLSAMYTESGLSLSDLPDIAKNPQVPGKGTDWQDAVYRTAPVQKYNISASGGTDNLNYNASISYLNQQGIMRTTGYDELTMRLKSDFTKGRFKVGESVLFGRYLTDRPNYDDATVGAMAYTNIPAFQIYDPDAVGGYQGPYGAVYHDDASMNPLAELNLVHQKNNNYRFISNLYGEVSIFDGLKFKSSFGATLSIDDGSSTREKYVVGAFPNLRNDYNKASRSYGINRFWQIENTLSYEKTFAGKHYINAILGQSAQKSQASSFSAAEQGLIDGIWSLSAGSGSGTVGGGSSASTLGSYFGRLIYSFDNRYIFTGTIRRDGSSRFGKFNIWGNFPSLALAWNIANEPLFKNLGSPVSELKLRGSWGKLGNQEIGNYVYIPTINSGANYIMGGTLWAGANQNKMTSSNLKWEETATTNLGFDLGLWNGKLTYSLDIYQRNTTNMLMGGTVTVSAGLGNPTVNAGEMTNKGFNMALTYNGHQGDFKYSVTGTLSHVKNNVEKLYSGTDIWGGSNSGGDWQPSTVTYTTAGYPIWGFWLIKTDGLFRTQAQIDNYVDKNGNKIQPNARVGDQKFVDANGDGKISDGMAINNSGDRVYCGSGLPDYEYGLRFEGSWKFIDVSFYLQGVHGTKIYNGERLFTESGFYIAQFSKDLLNSYTFTPTQIFLALICRMPVGTIIVPTGATAGSKMVRT